MNDSRTPTPRLALSALITLVAGAVCALGCTAPKQEADSTGFRPPALASIVAPDSTVLTLAIGATKQLPAPVWTSSNPAVAKVSSSGLVTAVGPGSATITVSPVTGSLVTVSAPSPPPPGTRPSDVIDLRVVSVTDTSVKLAWTGVTDGIGGAAKMTFRIVADRYSWGSGADVILGGCRTPLAGTTVGAHRSCTVLGLKPGTTYQFAGVAFRGILNKSAVFSANLTAVVTARTTGGGGALLVWDTVLVFSSSSTYAAPEFAGFGVRGSVTWQMCPALHFPANGAIALIGSYRAVCDTTYQRVIPAAARLAVTAAQQVVADSEP